MNKVLNEIKLSLLALLLVSPVCTGSLRAQALKVDPNAAAAPQSLEDRRKALNRLFDEYWQDNLRHSPEFASSLGDKRYNDQISDNSDGRRRSQRRNSCPNR